MAVICWRRNESLIRIGIVGIKERLIKYEGIELIGFGLREERDSKV